MELSGEAEGGEAGAEVSIAEDAADEADAGGGDEGEEEEEVPPHRRDAAAGGAQLATADGPGRRGATGRAAVQ